MRERIGSESAGDGQDERPKYYAATNPLLWKTHPFRAPLPQNIKEAIAAMLEETCTDDGNRQKYTHSLLDVIKQYSFGIVDLEELLPKEYTRSFSTVKYTDIAPHFGLDPNRKGRDISLLDVYRSRLSPELIMDVMKSVEKAEKVYGRLFEHQTEKVRDRYVQSLFSDIFAVFNARLKDESEGLLGSALTGDGLIEHLFVSFDSVSSFFLEMQIPAVEEGVVRLDQHAQVMAEAAVVDYQNFLEKRWVPVLGFLCDGTSLRFYLYDSAASKGQPSFYASRTISGVPHHAGFVMEEMIEGILRIAEYIFDFLILSFINSMRAFFSASHVGEVVMEGARDQRESNKVWEKAIRLAERAHMMLRSASDANNDEIAENGLEMLREAISMSPELPLNKLKRKAVSYSDFARAYKRRKVILVND